MKKVALLGLVMPAIWLASLGRGIEFRIPFADLGSIPYASLGILAFVSVGFVGLKRWVRWSKILVPALLVLLAGVLFWPCESGVPHRQYFALMEGESWKTYYGLHFTPGFLVVPALTLLAAWAVKAGQRMRYLWASVAIASVLLFAEPFFIAGVMTLIVGIALLAMGGCRSWKKFSALVLVGWVACAISVMFGRGLGFEILWPFPSDSYTPALADIWCALKNVGWWPWQADLWQNYNSGIPNAHREFVVLTAAQNMGHWVFVAVICAFISMAAASWRIVKIAKTKSGKVLSVGMALTILIPFAGNLLMLMGMLPLANLWVPFASEGRSILVPTCFAVGVLARIAMGDEGEDASERTVFCPCRFVISILCAAVLGVSIAGGLYGLNAAYSAVAKAVGKRVRADTVEEEAKTAYWFECKGDLMIPQPDGVGGIPLPDRIARVLANGEGMSKMVGIFSIDGVETNGVKVAPHFMAAARLQLDELVSKECFAGGVDAFNAQELRNEIRFLLSDRIKALPRLDMENFQRVECDGVNIMGEPKLIGDGSVQLSFGVDISLRGPTTLPLRGALYVVARIVLVRGRVVVLLNVMPSAEGSIRYVANCSSCLAAELERWATRIREINK